MKKIIFDFDGVIFNSEPLHWQALNEVCQPLGIVISYEEYAIKYIGLSDMKTIQKVLTEHHLPSSDAQLKTLSAAKHHALQRIMDAQAQLEAIPGVLEFVKANYAVLGPFGICSNAHRDELTGALLRLEAGQLQPYFQTMTSIDDVSAPKPSPVGYLKTAAALDILPSQGLVIEDTPTGISAAKAAGLTVVGITTTHRADALMMADYIADSYADIQDRVLPLWIKKL